MGFVAAIKSCLGKYATFSGRAARSEFWYFFLFTCLVLAPAMLLPPLAVVVIAALILPSWAVCARRLHDIDKSGWWALAYIIPVVGQIVLFLLWNCRKGDEGENRFGPNPLTGTPINVPAAAASPASSTTSMTEKAEQLAKIKALLESGAVTQEEFNRMKSDVLES